MGSGRGLGCRHRLAVLLLWGISFVAAAQASDGPYLTRDTVAENAGAGWTAHWVDEASDGLRVRREAVAAGDSITIPALGTVPAFQVHPRPPAGIAPDAITTEPGTPLLVVADTHGEYAILVELLQAQHVIDAHLHWSFGKGHVVFLGDVFDRGAQQLEILWLIYQLQAQAAKAGGGVELLLGNHEAMVLRGDLRYLHPRYPRSANALGAASYAALFGQDSVLGQWLRTRATVLKFDDVLLVHGGISPQVVARGLLPAQINQAVREVLDGTADPAASAVHEIVMQRHGPLWYRGYFSLDGAPAQASADDVDAALRHLGVAAILVGHTKMVKVTSLYAGRVIAVQVYPERSEKTAVATMEAVRRNAGRWHRVGLDGLREPLETNTH